MRKFVVSVGFCLVWTILTLVVVEAQTSTEGKVLRRSGEEIACQTITRVQPPYPAIAKAARASGEVKIAISVDEQGNVTSAEAVLGHPLLREAARAAARQWKFHPASVQEAKLTEGVILSFTFTLDGKVAPIPKARPEPVDLAERHLERGKKFAKDIQYDLAMREFRAALKLKPNYAWAHYELGMIQHWQRQFEEAEKSCAKARDLRLAELRAENSGEQDMLHENSLMCLGMNAAVALRYDEAIKYFRKIGELEKSRHDVRSMLGTVLFHKGDYNEAEKALQECLALKPEDAVALFTLGEVYSAQSRWKAAIDAYKQYIEVEDGPFSAASHYGLGIAYLRLGDKEVAMKEYQYLKRINNHEKAEQLLQEINKPQ